MHFSKYCGCGNDFIILDDREKTFPAHHKEIIRKLCHRQKGIGADGIVLLQPSCKADFTMLIFNSDGTQAEMCGNGIRCLGKFLVDIGIVKPHYHIETLYTIHRLAVEAKGISVDMGDPQEEEWGLRIRIQQEDVHIHRINTGVPHAVEFVENLEAIDMHKRGKEVRRHPLFNPKGTNYNAVQVLGKQQIAVRTYERGVEAETLACGTGATAAALAAAKIYGLSSPVQVRTKSGEQLTIGFEVCKGHLGQVVMTGPAERIYTGEIDLDVLDF